MDEMEKYRVDHLILLVGGNPLPNYVAGRLLAKHGATIHLVHSQRSFSIAQRLAECLLLPPESNALGGNFSQPQFIQVDERDPRNVFEKLSTLERNIGQGSVGLNYTSGNRLMSVHAYDAVATKRSDAKFSYLDANSLEMVVHDVQRSGNYFRADAHVKMRLATLLKLQGLKEKPNEPSSATPKQPKLAAALAELHGTDAGATTWFEWRRNGCNGWQQLPVNVTGLETVWSAIIDFWGDNPQPTQVASGLGYSSLPSSTEWWKAKWLEDHVLAELQIATAGRNDTNDAVKGVHSVRSGHGSRDFDLDVVVMRSFQLFVFSCIVSNNAQACKDHLMEAYVRARQTGGDEARVGLVCCVRNAQQLQDEIAGDLDAEGKIRVFGQSDLIQLSNHIRDWLNHQP